MTSEKNNTPTRAQACPACQTPPSTVEWGMASPFFSGRALEKDPAPTELLRCGACGTAWARQGLDAEQGARLYDGYRGEAYFKQRHATEPWYTRSMNDSMGSDHEMQGRRTVFSQALKRAELKGGLRPQGIVLDFGGDKGQLLADLPDTTLMVSEVSGIELCSWAKPAGDLGAWSGQCDLVMCCQVLEHVESPASIRDKIMRLARSGGWIYLEVPNESWTQAGAQAAWRHGWIERVSRNPKLTLALDFVSTASRLKFGVIPPFGFWSLREHMNFFTLSGLTRLAEDGGAEILWAGLTESGLSLVGRKK